MPIYELITYFSRVNKPDIGERKFDGYGPTKIGSWKMKKISVLVFQEEAKTGDIGKKIQRQAISIMKDTSACKRLRIQVNIKVSFHVTIHHTKIHSALNIAPPLRLWSK